MRILFVAMINSIHTARWINQLKETPWDVHAFEQGESSHVHPEMTGVTAHTLCRSGRLNPNVRTRPIWPFKHGFRMAKKFPIIRDMASPPRVDSLVRLIKKTKPDIIHSLETRKSGYLTLEAKKHFNGNFPSWIVSNWGNDIYLFGRLAAFKDKVRDVLSSCDYYFCETQRDVKLAREAGFKGEFLPVLPNCGGFNLERYSSFRQKGPVSSRRLIFIKGYQDWHGRSMVALRAIALCADLLRSRGYRIAIYSANEAVEIAAEILSQDTGIPVDIIPQCSSDEMMRLHGQARIHIGLAISDGIAIASIEAMTMGSFPIQSCTAAAEEWIVDGKTGFIVPPEDPEIVAAAIRKAASDDTLVDEADRENAKVVEERLDEPVIRSQVIEMYEKIYSQHEHLGRKLP
jgi:hypothetical protein